jgi:hypothetical protein
MPPAQTRAVLSATHGLCGVIAAAIALAGCASSPRGPTAEGASAPLATGAPPGAWSAQRTPCDASARMPAPVKKRVVREGLVIARIAWGIDRDGSRYEIACFDIPELTDASDQGAFLATMERRIGNNPGVHVTGRESAAVGESAAVDLRLAVSPERVGRYWIFLQSGRRLFEVSVVGPPGPRLTEGAEAFFGSFRIEREPPPARAAPEP